MVLIYIYIWACQYNNHCLCAVCLCGSRSQELSTSYDLAHNFRYCQLVILGTLYMPSHMSQKVTLMFTYMQKMNMTPDFFPEIMQRYCKPVKFFGHAWANPSKEILSTCRKLLLFICMKKSTSSLTSFLKYYKNITYLLFWALQACLATSIQYDRINF